MKYYRVTNEQTYRQYWRVKAETLEAAIEAVQAGEGEDTLEREMYDETCLDAEEDENQED